MFTELNIHIYRPRLLWRVDEWRTSYCSTESQLFRNGKTPSFLVIGKSVKHHGLKIIKILPVEYRSNKKFWMTRELFFKWLKSLNHWMKLKTLQFVSVMFLPPNTMSILQHLDQGIIQNFKVLYRKVGIKISTKIWYRYYQYQNETISIS